MRQHPLFKNRYIPNADWSGRTIVVYDIYRLFERVFGRKKGIRAESSVKSMVVNGRRVLIQEFYTLEAVLTYFECGLRKFFRTKKFSFDWVDIPVFQPAGFLPQDGKPFRIPIFTFAIANTATVVSGFTSNGTTCTMSLTTSGSDRCVIGAVWTWNAADTYTSTTYAGTTMTELVNRAADGSGSKIRLVGCHNATTGTNDMVSNTSGNMQHINTAAAYSGVDSTSAVAAFPDTETNGTTAGVTSITASITTSVANSWVFLHARTPSRDMTAGTDTTERCQSSTSGDSANLFDSNGGRSTGSNDLNYTWTGSQTSYWVMGSMAPVSGSSIVPSLATLGVGA